LGVKARGDTAKRAAPNDYTLLQLDSEHLAALPRTPFLVAVASNSKWKSMADLIPDAKSKPGKVNFGSWGVGSPGHLGAEQLEMMTGAEQQHVPFREVAQLYTAVGAGDVDWSFATIPSSQGVYKAGTYAELVRRKSISLE
jgi:tripartite-type tricarboxylate transporter receptor subunit TctC